MEVKSLKIDLVMWTFNGAKTLEPVLKQINSVIPESVVNQKIIVDDGSTDQTVEVAEACGWRVIRNEGRGISDGANTALRHVETEWFCSFEQDLLLTPKWWSLISKWCGVAGVGAISGMRFASQPKGLMALQNYVAKKYRGERYISSWLKSREISSFTLGKTLDNTFYFTESLRCIGGFPKLKTNAGVDTVLAYKLKQAGYEWLVDYTVRSIHLRNGLMDELKHQYSYGLQLKEIWRNVEVKAGVKPPINKFGVFSRLFISPLTGMFVAFKTGEPSVFLVHPLIRFYYTWGLLNSEF